MKHFKAIVLFFQILGVGLAFSQVEINQQQSMDTTPESTHDKQPLRVGVVGLDHTHVHWILGREDRGDIEIVGIVEPNRDLAARYARQHGYSMDLVFDTLDAMVNATRPEAVTAFNSIDQHLEVVQYCAPRGIHVMVEKPMAMNWEHAREMIGLAKEHDIALLTNYETSWYPSTHEAFKLAVIQDTIGGLRKMVFHTGHPGPIEIGCNPEFLDWLTDPDRNGGGALTDFGCYGANIATWMLQGQTPETVYCTTQQHKPEKYPKVEDEATIVLNYPETQVIIQASWNWPYNRKDMEVYGTTGYIVCKTGSDMAMQISEQQGAKPIVPENLKAELNDPFTLLREVVHNNHKLETYALSSLENNRIVMQILEAARISAEMGCEVRWSTLFPGE